MGHCEMLLAVAGLDSQAIADRTRRLASGDWSVFAPAEQAAFAFARKQATAPWSVRRADVQDLLSRFNGGPGLDVIWWACRCHYMTRVADAFQLPLERDNVFQSPPTREAARPPKATGKGNQPH
jgi:hypothetical protein